ncbi:hypothetical protein NLX86_18740 [Streptomyces sp. A3M-1-3]|uniref:hypothetical protein n=1 Tax=Streptomyces sp. A3M-1-3 TaxID=2962044 RepID=UPI0020B70CB1|nr:hypothetical protein [Streptomyces sp. A3M-1-3]MCP3820055.1 hypothetical protein [Streptomyces sp. A3M-1-3]
MTILTTTELAPTGLYSTDEVVATTLPVDLPVDTWRTMLRVVVPAAAGDLLDVDARARVTNDVGYNVGVGWHLWAYDTDSGQGTAGPWWKLAPSSGDNVDPARHHMPLHITAVHQVPADWPAGHRITVVLRADAHSTAWQSGDTLTVDPLGVLTVRRWTTSPPAPGVCCPPAA